MKLLSSLVFLGLLALFLGSQGGCATKRVDWQARVGLYTYDDVIRELGPPDKSAKLSDGSLVADWITGRGMQTATAFGGGWYPYGPYGSVGPSYVIVDPPAPDRILRLAFDPQGKLASWQQVYK